MNARHETEAARLGSPAACKCQQNAGPSQEGPAQAASIARPQPFIAQNGFAIEWIASYANQYLSSVDFCIKTHIHIAQQAIKYAAYIPCSPARAYTDEGSGHPLYRLLPVPFGWLGMAPGEVSPGACAGGTAAPLDDAGGFTCGAGALFLSQAVSAAAAATSTRGVSSFMSDSCNGWNTFPS
ncbi:hypothetical protein [Comamonas terrae]|uniref:hypothetical protein n=1 Tax=Comamonas terrae TaxID=673548 RepID=UPI000B221A90|nr:hypothetical protein [Comamonas terrae]